LAKQDNLRVKLSTVPNTGEGLFAWKRPFKKNAEISKYTGQRLTKNEIDKKYGDETAKYAICNGNRCIDANYTTDAAARFANDAYGTRFKTNSYLKGRNHFRLKAKKKIKPHQEIFTSYGKDYWRSTYILATLLSCFLYMIVKNTKK
jgi:hypothetical protein